MRTEIAKTDLGACPCCGVRMDQGDWVSTEAGKPTRHTGCKSWRGSDLNNKADAPVQSGFLFSISDDAAIDHAKEVLNVKTISFDGASTMQIDTPRLALQIARVFQLMKDGKYRTLRQISNATKCLETSSSARLRDLRKPKFGGHTVDARRADCPGLVYEYRLTLSEEKETDGRRNAA